MVSRYLSQIKFSLVLALFAVCGAHVAAAQTMISIPVYFNGSSIGYLFATTTASGVTHCGPPSAGGYYEANFDTFSGWTFSQGGWNGGGGVERTEATDYYYVAAPQGGCPAQGWTPSVPITMPFTGGTLVSVPAGYPTTVTDYEVVFYGTQAYLTYCAKGCS